MFNFFKNKESKETPSEVAIAERVVDNKIAQSVEEIHHEFESAGEKILAEARRIIEQSNLSNEDKVVRLKRVGFGRTQEAEDGDKLIKIRKQNEKIAAAIEELNFSHPTYKVITQEVVDKICEKYNLVLGESSRFKGFVPEKNLQEIEKFLLSEKEFATQYLRRNSSFGFEDISKEEYDEAISLTRGGNETLDDQQEYMWQAFISARNSIFSYHKRDVSLLICAPLKDMDMKGYELKGRQIVKVYPDPVVLCPIVRHGIKLYIIVTAWGDEASDELVVNPREN